MDVGYTLILSPSALANSCITFKLAAWRGVWRKLLDSQLCSSFNMPSDDFDDMNAMDEK